MSMVDATPSETSSENGNNNTSRTYDVEILSTEILDESYIDGVKVTKLLQTVRQTDMPTLEDFTEDNREYFDFLIDERGAEGRNTVERIKSEFTTDIEKAQDQYEIEVIKYGEHSITFEPKTRSSASFSGTVKDPINIVFWHDGRASEAKSKIDYNAPHSWHGALGGTQYVYVDETSHGGTAHWQSNNFQLEEGSYFDTRYHLRIFNGGNSNHDSFKYWSIGAVHKETWNGSGHTLVSNAWETSESHLKSDLDSTSGILSVGTINLSNSGFYQGIWNNGVAGYIKVQ
jgi:hypothetical protein